jgi:hypothetical protein
VGATGAYRLFDIHRLRIAFRETPRARLIPEEGRGAMQTWDALTARRNVREFEDRPLAAEHLRRTAPFTQIPRPLS